MYIDLEALEFISWVEIQEKFHLYKYNIQVLKA